MDAATVIMASSLMFTFRREFYKTFLFTDPGIVAGVGRTFSRVCLFVRALKGKQLELSTPNLVHVYPIAVARHALTQR